MLCSLLPPSYARHQKLLVERLSLKQESVKDKSLLERIEMDPTPSTKLYDKLVEADPCWHKVDNLYFASCPPELQEIIMHKGVQRTPGTYLGSDITIFH